MHKISLPMRFLLICCLGIAGVYQSSMAQVFTNKEVGVNKVTVEDSIKNRVYPYSLPILGEKATQAGYQLPYSAGVSVQYFGSESDLVINNLKVGFNGREMFNLDEIVRFDKAVATAQSITVRPDLWLFPFLNIYGILGISDASTDIGFSVWIPDQNGGNQQILSAETVVEFTTTSFGLGMTPTIGVGGGFIALDMNVVWTDVPQLAQPARSFVFGPRFGKSFTFRKNPDSNIAVWVGGFRVDISGDTKGSLALSEVLPEDSDIEMKIDDAQQRVGETQVELDDWWNNLTPIEQANPVNAARYNAGNRLLGTAGQVLAAAENAVENVQNSTVQYSMDKQVKDKWNFVVGSQYQINRHLMLRGEIGFLGSRNQVIAGLQYRFGL